MLNAPLTEKTVALIVAQKRLDGIPMACRKIRLHSLFLSMKMAISMNPKSSSAITREPKKCSASESKNGHRSALEMKNFYRIMHVGETKSASENAKIRHFYGAAKWYTLMKLAHVCIILRHPYRFSRRRVCSLDSGKIRKNALFLSVIIRFFFLILARYLLKPLRHSNVLRPPFKCLKTWYNPRRMRFALLRLHECGVFSSTHFTKEDLYEVLSQKIFCLFAVSAFVLAG